MFVIVYTPGYCGNIVAATIDSTDYKFINISKPKDSSNIIGCHLKNSNPSLRNLTLPVVTIEDVNHYYQYLDDCKNLSKAVPSHRLWIFNYWKIDFGKYPHIYITTNDSNLHKWVDDRIDLMTTSIKYEHVNYSKYFDKIIDLKDIINGNLINVLSQWINVDELDKNIYKQWLEKNKKQFYF